MYMVCPGCGEHVLYCSCAGMPSLGDPGDWKFGEISCVLLLMASPFLIIIIGILLDHAFPLD